MAKKLENKYLLKNVSWKEFFIEDICEIKSGKDIYERERIEGVTPYVTATANNNGIGYLIYVSNPYIYEVGLENKIYIYQNIAETENSLYGFKTKAEKNLFLKLISVKGLGPKMTLPLLATGSVDGIMDAIERENVLYLKKFPKIGDKLAKQIILDLKGKLEFIGLGISDKEVEVSKELENVLLGLGYKEKEIKPVIAKVDTSLKLEDQVKDALKLMLR